ncbi:methyl-accepting chemotaxis protein [Gorillibacterium timonense]|uniref:methyl-accepting chemotaxis protein n=1 Tax=Gorillibacterium timonense TaxID=1689269 RepID=UPI00071CBCE0|nr:methyl-accepting chemotaxis protein [Gorillibacterium timonense]
MDKLTALILAAPLFKQIHSQDIMIGITDKEVFHYYEPSKILNFGLTKGSPIPSEDPTLANALAGNATTNRLSPELYGTSVISSAVPIFGEEGEVIGAFALAYTLENEDKMEQLTDSINHISGQLVDMVQNVAAQSEELSATTAQILENSRKTVEESKQVNKVAGFIREISDQTNLLGLNAAIEAARVGEQGAGFGVVAAEVRKLSVNTKEATKTIDESLSLVQRSIRQMEQEIEAIAASSYAQAELVTEFSNVIERLNETSSEMARFISSVLH